MLKSEKRLILIEGILTITFLLNIFVINIFNYYLVTLLFAISTIIVVFLMGYERDKSMYKKSLVFSVMFYTFIFMAFLYASGLILGYRSYPYNHEPFRVLLNILPVVLVITLSEMFRYVVCSKGGKNKIIFVLTITLFVLSDMYLNMNGYDLSNLSKLIEFTTIIILPSIIKNIALTLFAVKYGLSQNLAYRYITELYYYIIPITPDLGAYLESVIMMIYPFVLIKLMSYTYDRDKKKVDIRDSKKISIFSIVALIFAIIVVCLNSNLFRFWIAAVGSGSMEHTIEIGDAIFVDKYYSNHLDELKVGDILVFKVNTNIYTHRIIDIKNENGNYRINTKGDREGQAEDSWVVTNKDVIGVVKFRIRYIGWPTVWLGRLLEEK